MNKKSFVGDEGYNAKTRAHSFSTLFILGRMKLLMSSYLCKYILNEWKLSFDLFYFRLENQKCLSRVKMENLNDVSK
jgi:hypothetical protein